MKGDERVLNRKKTAGLLGAVMAGICLVFVGLYTYISSQSFMETAASQAGRMATELLATKVDLGRIEIVSWRELKVEGLDVYDKKSERLAHVDEAVVRLSPRAMLDKSFTEGISEIDINKADVIIIQREDGSWNYEDLLSEKENSSKFTAKINIKDSILRSNYNNQPIVLEDVNGYVDMASYPAISLKADCTNQGAKARVSATLDTSDMAKEGKAGGRQTFQLTVENAAVENYLLYLPADAIPENVVNNISGQVKSLQVAGERVGQELIYHGQVELDQGKCTLLSHEVENIKALATFNEKEARIFARAETQGQQASVHGRIILTSGIPELDLQAESEGFEPAVIMEDIPYTGAVKFAAHITGAADNPRVDAHLQVTQGAVQGIGFSNLTAQVSYADSMVVIQQAQAQAAGGTISATGSFDAKSYDFTGNVQMAGISASQAAAIASAQGLNTDFSTVAGTINGDFAVAGNGHNVEQVQVYGTLKGSQLSYQGITMDSLKGSFAREGETISIDYLSCGLPGGGSFGMEGTIVPDKTIDIAFYGSEMDMSLLSNFLPDVPVAGSLDIKGTMQGDINNPIVRAQYAAHDGQIYHQPFDRLHGSAAGSLRGVKIDDFVMEHGEKTKWYAKGMVGFLGDKGINMRIDTVGARMEDIMQAVAPDQKLTGNVDNVITITGTLKDPNVVGYVHFYQGSYNGIFVNGMDGDYYIKDRNLILQDFHVFTPWLDVDFNGTIDKEGKLDLAAKVHEINLSRYNKNLPIPLQGKARFNGKLTGDLANPLFEGKLEADDLAANGQEITNVGGIVRYENRHIFMDNLSFQQNEGQYKFTGHVNIDNKRIKGRLDVDKGDIHNLAAMAGLKDNGITGTITGNSMFGGTLDEPKVNLSAFITKGALGSYAMDDVILKASLDKRRIYIEDFSGQEGAEGRFSAKGVIDMDGDINIKAVANNIDIGALTEAAGIKNHVGGTLDTAVNITGPYAAPRAEIPLSIKNLQVESTLIDKVEGNLQVANNIVEIKDLTATKMYADQSYSLTAQGRVPLAALTEEMPNAANQFDVNISLANADLSLLPTLSKYIDWAVGPTDGRMKLQGTLASPYITGSMNVYQGAFKIRDVAKPVTDLNMRLLFTGHDVTLEECHGQMGAGSFDITGYAHLAGNKADKYNLSVACDNLDIDSPVFKGPLNATLNVDSMKFVVPGIEEQIIPKISGRLFLENVLISPPNELPESSDDMPLAALDYSVELGKNVRFLSPTFGDLRLAGGAYFGGYTIHPSTAGSIYVKRGTLSYLKTNFKVYEGSINFGQVNTLMPKVVLKAGTKINKNSVYLSLDGIVPNMHFKLMSDPKMAEADIIQLLTLRSDYFNKDKSEASKLTSMLNIGLQMTILSEVEAAMRNVLNLDVLTIERDTIDGSKNLGDVTDGRETEKNGDKNAYEVYNITLGKNISDKTLIKYTQSMTTSDFSYGVDYELSNKINLTYQRNQDNDYYAGVEARFTF